MYEAEINIILMKTFTFFTNILLNDYTTAQSDYVSVPIPSGDHRGAITELLITSRHPFQTYDVLNYSEILRLLHSLMVYSIHFI